MPSLRSLCLFAISLPVLIGSVFAEPANNNNEVVENAPNFQELLNSVSDELLHAALHNYSPSKFKHGVFQEDRSAIEAIHRENAASATSLISMAKRQANSSTAATHATTSGALITSTNAAGKTIVSTVGGGMTTVTGAGAVSSTPTSAAGASQITSTLLQISTLPNGMTTTITSYAGVDASASSLSTPSGSAGASPSPTSGKPSVQSGAASLMGKVGAELMALTAGAVVVAMVF